VETLHKVLAGKLNLTELLRRRESSILFQRKAKGSVATYVNFDDQSSEKYSIMEIVTRDRYGLLSTIAKVIAQSKCNIDCGPDFYGRPARDRRFLSHSAPKTPLSSSPRNSLPQP
jgi:hypothetical protein